MKSQVKLNFGQIEKLIKEFVFQIIKKSTDL
jgi:hypothetical protein